MKDDESFEEKSSSIKVPSARSIYDEFFTTYTVQPFQNKVSMVVIMADRGSRLQKNDLSDFTTLKKSLKMLKEIVDLLAKKMCHGDLLPHNFVIDRIANTLHIIDLDEGDIDEVPRREIPENTDENMKWFSALQYPNPLRNGNKELYTKVQFAAAFLMLTGTIKSEINDEDSKHLVKIEQLAAKLGRKLVAADTAAPLTKAFAVADIAGAINSIDKKINILLGVEDE